MNYYDYITTISIFKNANTANNEADRFMNASTKFPLFTLNLSKLLKWKAL